MSCRIFENEPCKIYNYLSGRGAKGWFFVSDMAGNKELERKIARFERKKG